MKNLSETFSPLRTMKKWAVCAVLVLMCASANAQSVDFEKLAEIKGVEYFHVGKDMIKLAAKEGKGLHVGETFNIGDGEEEEYFNQFDDVKVFSCEEKGSVKKFKKTALNLLKGRQWEPLLETTGDEGEIVKIYLSKNGEHSTNVILSIEDDEANLVVIDGTFDLAKMIQEGMKGKVEVNN